MEDYNKEAYELINLSAIVQFSEDPIISKNLSGIITSWNPAAERVFGYKANEAIGMSIMKIVPKEREAEEKDIIEKISRGEFVENYQTYRVHKDGHQIMSSITVSPVKNKQQQIIGASTIIRDITKQYQDNEKQATLAAIVDSSEDAIISKTLEGRVTSWNRAAERLFGYTAEEMIGRPITTLFPQNKLPEEEHIIDNISKGLKVEHFETIRLKKNGQPFHCALTISPIKDQNGKITGASKIVRDISQRVAMEEQVKQYTRQLEKINRYKDEFINVVSHELKTPVTSIKGYTQLLYRELHGNNDNASGMLQKMDTIILRLVSLIDDLLEAARIQQNQLEINPANFNLKSAIDEAIAALGKPDRDFQINAAHLENIMVRADRKKIYQVIYRLISNAIKYSNGQGEIIIGMKKKNDKVICYIQDHGVGISSQDLSKVFNRFYKFRGDRKGLYPGLGLGLFISSAVIQQQGGEMWVESVLGDGSTFYFSLPLIEHELERE